MSQPNGLLILGDHMFLNFLSFGGGRGLIDITTSLGRVFNQPPLPIRINKPHCLNYQFLINTAGFVNPNLTLLAAQRLAECPRNCPFLSWPRG